MSIKSTQPKLTVELVPKTCHFSNVRTTIKPSEWDKIRFISYEAANNKCEICKATGKEQGYKHNVECHEIWEYNDTTHVQKLVGLISLCVICHQVKHIGRAIAMGKQGICFAHLGKINKWTPLQVQEHIVASFELHKQRSKHPWTLDISLLEKAPYNIVLPILEERVFVIKKWKKKKKKKTTTKTVHPKAKISAVLKPKATGGKKTPPRKPK